MTRLIIWRHGRTAWNAEQRTQGQTDVDLDAHGVAQAATAAQRIAAQAPDLIISSDLARARHTAAPLAERTGLPVKLDARLRERHFGDWQGLTATELQSRWPEQYAQLGSVTPVEIAGIESSLGLARRAAEAFRDAAESVGDGTAVLVTHGGTARLGCAELMGWPPELWHTLGLLDNCGITDLRRHSTGRWLVHAHNT